jgi:hypothetical protein
LVWQLPSCDSPAARAYYSGKTIRWRRLPAGGRSSQLVGCALERHWQGYLRLIFISSTHSSSKSFQTGRLPSTHAQALSLHHQAASKPSIPGGPPRDDCLGQCGRWSSRRRGAWSAWKRTSADCYLVLPLVQCVQITVSPMLSAVFVGEIWAEIPCENHRRFCPRLLSAEQREPGPGAPGLHALSHSRPPHT